MKRIYNHILALVCLLLSGAATPVQAGPTTVKAKLDSVSILMGNITTLNLQVVQDKQSRGGFKFLQGGPNENGYVGVCGDSVELRTSVTCDTLDLGSGRIQIDYKVPVQAFDSGMYRIPALEYITGIDTVKSNPVTLKVVPVPGVTADSQISGYADVLDPAKNSVFDPLLDILPDFIVDFWWLFLLILLAIGIFVYVLMKRKKEKGSWIPRKPLPPSWEIAKDALARLKARNLPAQGLEREYFTELTEILREYLDARFGINAMEMTSAQILERIEDVPDTKDKKGYIEAVQSVADIVKFAAVKPLPEDSMEAYDNAVRFVDETTPKEPEALKAAKEAEEQRRLAATVKKGKADGKKQVKKSPRKAPTKKKGGKK